MVRWTLEKLVLPLKREWKISRGSVFEKENYIVTYSEGKLKGKGEVAFITNGDISKEEVEQGFKNFADNKGSDLNGLEDIMARIEESELPANLRFGIESAYVHFLAQLMEDTPQRVLGVREVTNIATSFSIPHMGCDEIEDYFQSESLQRFFSLKVKITSENDIDYVRKIGSLFSGPLRLDGNECFSDARIAGEFLKEISDLNIELVEQPISHSHFDECCRLREMSSTLLMADESLQDGPVIDDFQRAFHGVNIKLQKAGGYIKAMNQIREARALGFKTMLGCMIESSLGISSAMVIGHGVDFYDLDGFLHLKKDPFDHVFLEKGHLLYSYHH